MRNRLIALAAVFALAGCGGGTPSTSSVAGAIEGKRVASLFAGTGLVSVGGAVCTPTSIAGNYTCTGKPAFAACKKSSAPTAACASATAPTEVWIACFPNKGGPQKFFCQLEDPPAGTDVFVTAAQRNAPKQAEWRCLASEVGGVQLGPFSISIVGSFGPVETRPEYVTRAKAAALAKAMHLKFVVVCG